MSKAKKTSCPAYFKTNGDGLCKIYQGPCTSYDNLFDGKCISPGEICGVGEEGIKRILEIGLARYELEKSRKKNEKLYE